MTLNFEDSDTIFNKDYFAAETFTVEDFIVDVRKYTTNLKVAIEGLQDYQEKLRYRIIQHINEDYIDYLILISNMIGQDKYIKNIITCLQKVEEEVVKEKRAAKEQMISANNIMTEKKELHRIKVLFYHDLTIVKRLETIKKLDCLDFYENASLITIERMTLELNLANFHLKEADSSKHLHSDKEKLEKISSNVENYLEFQLLQSISENNIQTFTAILHIYAILDKKEVLKSIFRRGYVESFMVKEMFGKNLTKYGLVCVYDKILAFVSKFCGFISAAKEVSDEEAVFDCDSVAVAVRTEVIRRTLSILPKDVYSPGDVQQFHENYSASVKFIQSFEQCFTVLTNMREQGIYKEFFKVWNLEAYFRIRFIEIALEYERRLHSLNEKDIKVRDSVYKLNASKALIESLNTCWSEKVFLSALSHEFWKLTLQLISRHNTWSSGFIKHCKKEDVSFYQTLAALILDVEQLVVDYESIFHNEISRMISKNCIELAFLDSVETLKKIAIHSEETIIESLTKQCCDPISFAADIPKLYRKTNREIPTKPSEYVITIRRVLSDFSSDMAPVMPEEKCKPIMQPVINGFLSVLTKTVEEVLMSVKKSEESLKMLKRMKNKETSVTKGEGISDYEKIKFQLVLDVSYIEDFLGELKISSIEKINKIKEFMNKF